MKKTIFAFLFCVSFINAQAQYNNMWNYYNEMKHLFTLDGMTRTIHDMVNL
jgi:hypothetical protein